MSGAYDVLVKGGTVIDGTGRPRFAADVAVKGGRIAAVGQLAAATAAQIIDGAGAVVCPGFIDVHNHADGTIVSYPQAESFVMQGTTTTLTGHCGFSPAPLVDKYLFSFWEFRFWPDIAPYMFHEPLIHPLAKVRQAAQARIGLDIDWHGFGEWLGRLEDTKVAINIAPLVGHNTIRAQVMGDDHARRPSAVELEEMKRLLRAALADGARGFSSGVDYLPGAYADTDELVAMAEVTREHGGLHSMHWRRTGIRRADAPQTGPPDKLAGIRGAIEISRQSGVKLLIAHIASGYTIFPEPRAELAAAAATATTRYIDEAVADGLDVAFDVIPNTDGGVLLSSYILGPLVPWVRAAGSVEGLQRALAMPEFRAELRAALEAGRWYNFQPKAHPAWAERLTILEADDQALCGRTVAGVAEARSADPLETLFDLVAAEPRARVRAIGHMPEAEKRAFFAHPRAMMGSDTFAFDDTWEVEHPPFLLPHPNTYSAVPWYLERYAPGDLETKIHKLTGWPASWLGLHDRGAVAEGYWADLVVFEPDNYRAQGDYLEPRRYPTGVRSVMVNGGVVVSDGRHTGDRPGAVLRRG